MIRSTRSGHRSSLSLRRLERVETNPDGTSAFALKTPRAPLVRGEVGTHPNVISAFASCPLPLRLGSIFGVFLACNIGNSVWLRHPEVHDTAPDARALHGTGGQRGMRGRDPTGRTMPIALRMSGLIFCIQNAKYRLSDERAVSQTVVGAGAEKGRR